MSRQKQHRQKSKNCPAGHQLKEVLLDLREREKVIGSPGFTCDICENNFDLEGGRFRCDDWELGTACDFNLCGECFYKNKSDKNVNLEENSDYWKQVVENIKHLLLDQHRHNGIWEILFAGAYKSAFGEAIDFEKLGFPPKNRSNQMKFLNKLVGIKVLEMAYIDNRMMIKPSKSLLSGQSEKRADTICSLLEMLDVGDDTVWGVRKQVQYPAGLKEDDSLNIFVTEILTPGKFWFQLRGENTTGALDQLQDELEKFYGTTGEKCHLKNPLTQCKSGEIMAAPYMEHGYYIYHRVLINQVSNKTKNAQVFYVDYGTTSIIPISTVRILHENFRQLPAQALEAKLWGIKVPSGRRTWPKESIGRFHQLTYPLSQAGWGVVAIVKRVENDAYSGVIELELYDVMTNDSPGGSCINQKLVEEGLARKEECGLVMESIKLSETSSLTAPNIGANRGIGAGGFAEVRKEGIGKKMSAIDPNNNPFNLSKKEQRSAKNESEGAVNRAKFSICKVNLIEKKETLLVINEKNIWISSGDLSSLMPTWRGKDILAKMLQVKHINIQSFSVDQEDKERFGKLIMSGMQPNENMKFIFYPLDSVKKLLDIFNKDEGMTKLINEKIEAVVSKLKLDFGAY